MTTNSKTLLVVEPDPNISEFIGVALEADTIRLEYLANVREAANRLEDVRHGVDALLIDCTDSESGLLLTTVEDMQRLRPALPILLIADKRNMALAEQAMRRGALQVISKPLVYDELKGGVLSALRCVDRPETAAGFTPGTTLDTSRPQSAWARKITQVLTNMSHSDVPVLLQGETGVGKEVLSRQIHDLSQRAKKPFLKLNCAALPAELIESELFGYDRGAFTGAFKSTPGKFELANGGTILLDEIGDMDVKLQAKLLQVLQDREFLRLGARETTRVDVRVIAATHRNLELNIEEGRFREDLYYRLNVITITIPALRERRDEILSIAEYLLERHSQPGQQQLEISPALQRALLDHDWPGNIRELENTMRRYLVLRNEQFIIEELDKKVRRKMKRGIAVVNGPSDFGADHLSQFEPADVPIPSFPVSWPTVNNGSSKDDTFAIPALDRDRLPADYLNPGNATAALPTYPANFGTRPAGPIPVPPPAVSGATKESPLMQVDDARKQAEIRVIVDTLNATLWNRKQAARLLKLDYKALLYKMKKLQIGEQHGMKEVELH